MKPQIREPAPGFGAVVADWARKRGGVAKIRASDELVQVEEKLAKWFQMRVLLLPTAELSCWYAVLCAGEEPEGMSAAQTQNHYTQARARLAVEFLKYAR